MKVIKILRNIYIKDELFSTLGHGKDYFYKFKIISSILINNPYLLLTLIKIKTFLKYHFPKNKINYLYFLLPEEAKN